MSWHEWKRLAVTSKKAAAQERKSGAASRASRPAGSRGFTFVEMLAALLVVTLLTGMVAMGTTVAASAYATEQFASQADVLSGEIENALAAHYRFAQSESPELTVSNGQFVLNAGGQTPLLNSSAYGECTVELLGGAAYVKPVRQADGTLVIEGDYQISRAGSHSEPRQYHFYFKSYGDSRGEGGYSGITSSAEGSGGSGDSEKEHEAINAARAALAELITTAKAIEQGNKYADAYNQLQADIAAAEGWRDNNDATEQQLKDAKTALEEAIQRFNNSATTGEEVWLTGFEITLNPDAAEYEVGQTGTASAVATYSDNSTKTEASWSSSNPSVVSVDASTGAFTCNASGSATLTATIDGESQSVNISVAGQGDVAAPTNGSQGTEEQLALSGKTPDGKTVTAPTDPGMISYWSEDSSMGGLYLHPSWGSNYIQLLYVDGEYYVPVQVSNATTSYPTYDGPKRWFDTSASHTKEQVTSGSIYEAQSWNWIIWVKVK